ncbi:MAG: hypothetical protein RBS53_01975, partial [Bacteroidales bacterium]|nr:hypothetical protein [Bacteroidales bacterium]
TIPDCAGEVIFTYTWEDCLGEEYSWNYVFTIEDPVVEIPADGFETVECYSDVYVPVAPQLFDNCGRELMVSAAVVTEDFDGCEGTVVNTFIYTDCAGVEYGWNYTFNIIDTTAPEFTYVPADITLECDDPDLACIFPMNDIMIMGSKAVADNCGSHSVVLSDVVYQNGYTTFTYTVTSGSSPALSHWVLAFCGSLSDVNAGPGTIELGLDPTTGINGIKFDDGLESGQTMDFYITLPGMWNTGMIQAAVKAGTNHCYYMVEGPVCDDVPPCEPDMPTAMDNCDDDVTITYVDEMTPGDCASEFVVIRTFTAADNCGNTATAQQTITVVDTTAPVFTFVPEDATYECDEEIILVMATAEDNCGDAEVTYEDEITEGDCPQAYTITRTFTADDGCGNIATEVQIINVVDTTAPVFTFVPEGTTYACEEAIDLEMAIAEDNCGEVVVTYNDVITDVVAPNEYTIERTFTATDECNNASTAVQIIMIIPIEVTLEPLADVCLDVEPFELSGGLPLGGVYTGAGVSNNIFDPAIAGAGTFEITYTFTDEDGCFNSATAFITVHPLPVVTLEPFESICDDEAAFILEGGMPLGGIYSGLGVADGMFNPVVAGVGIHEITYTYTDENGCTNFAVETIEVLQSPCFTYEFTDVNCFGADDGTITVTVDLDCGPVVKICLEYGTIEIPSDNANKFLS